MRRRQLLKGAGAVAMMSAMITDMAAAQDSDTVYELRTYHLNEGKLEPILERFRSKETAIFERVGMHPVAYWVPTEEPLAGKTLIYMLRHRSRDAAKESWAKFTADPEWIALKAETERNGPFLTHLESTFLKLTDFSPKL